jgi:hypothetical protein
MVKGKITLGGSINCLIKSTLPLQGKKEEKKKAK